MNGQQIVDWLLEGDVSLQYQVRRDLLGDNRKDLQDRIDKVGWGKQFLSQLNPNGYWGQDFYLPKWTSTHYTLLDLRNLNINSNNDIIRDVLDKVLSKGKAGDGGIPLGPSTLQHSDVCVNGMFLNYASYFLIEEKHLSSVVDSILGEIMPDGGFNCVTTRRGAHHSSLHSTISVLEGFQEYLNNQYSYRENEIRAAIKSSIEFILQHQLFISDRTGKIIRQDFLKFPYPPRWKYDILRALDYFQYGQITWDRRMESALSVLKEKRTKDNRWKQYAAYPGKFHFKIEEAGKPSRWNTLRALRVLKYFEK